MGSHAAGMPGAPTRAIRAGPVRPALQHGIGAAQDRALQYGSGAGAGLSNDIREDLRGG